MPDGLVCLLCLRLFKHSPTHPLFGNITAHCTQHKAALVVLCCRSSCCFLGGMKFLSFSSSFKWILCCSQPSSYLGSRTPIAALTAFLSPTLQSQLRAHWSCKGSSHSRWPSLGSACIWWSSIGKERWREQNLSSPPHPKAAVTLTEACGFLLNDPSAPAQSRQLVQKHSVGFAVLPALI